MFFHLFFQCAVVTVFIHLLVLQKLIVLDTATKLLRSEKEILNPVLLRSARRAACCGNRKRKIQML